MSISEQINRIKNNISSAYAGLEAKNANMPLERNSANLRVAIDSIKCVDPPLTYSQMNPAAASYISEIDYTQAENTLSSIGEYAGQITDYDKHKGAGVKIDLGKSGELVLIDGYNGTILSNSVSAGETEIFNLTPGTRSFYLLVCNHAIVQCGALYPTGSLRMIHPKYMGNVRDLGGWECDGGTVKYGKLFRGCAVYNRQDDRVLLHDALGIRAELDLRWDSEIEAGMEAYNMTGYYSLIGDDVELKHIDGAWYNIDDDEKMKSMLGFVFEVVENDTPLYFHCVTGADRTGTLAMILEALLGMSQSDIDKDYELTSFYTGVDTDAHARLRNETEWRGLVAAFNGFIGNTLRDRVVNWAETIGISIDRINAFREKMIDGSPTVLMSSVGTASITKSLSGTSVDNAEASRRLYRPYVTTVTPDSEKLISTVRVTMDGLDVTNKVFRGVKSVLRHSVSMSLNNCSVNTDRKAVVSGECFCCKLTALTGYTLEGATVQITMGGISVPNYYSEGMINIPKVTGNIVISATAVPTVLPYTNQITHSVSEIGGSTVYNNGLGYKDGYRYNSSSIEAAETTTAPSFTTGFIHLEHGDVVRLYGDVFSGTDGGMNTAVFDNSGNRITKFTPAAVSTASSAFTGYCSSYIFDSVNNVLSQFTWGHSTDGWIKFTLTGRFDPETSIITINEEI